VAVVGGAALGRTLAVKASRASRPGAFPVAAAAAHPAAVATTTAVAAAAATPGAAAPEASSAPGTVSVTALPGARPSTATHRGTRPSRPDSKKP
jgi:hypothetical protein